MIYFFHCEHGEEMKKSFIDNINKMHLTIKFMADWSRTSINFLDVMVSIAEGVIETDLNVKLTDSHQYLIIFLSSFIFQKGYTIQPGTNI